MAEMDGNIEDLTTKIIGQDRDIENGKAELDAAKVLSSWLESDQDQLEAWDQFHQLLPGTDRLYVVELKSTPQSGAKLIKIAGTIRARDKDDIDNLEQGLADSGWKVNPSKLPLEVKKDPDYPWQIDLEAELLRSPAEKKPAKKSPTVSSSPVPSNASTTN